MNILYRSRRNNKDIIINKFKTKHIFRNNYIISNKKNKTKNYIKIRKILKILIVIEV